jgi:hypothetical protein
MKNKKLKYLFIVLVSLLMAITVMRCHAQTMKFDNDKYISHLVTLGDTAPWTPYYYKTRNQVLHVMGVDTLTMTINKDSLPKYKDTSPWKPAYYDSNRKGFQLNYNDYDLDMGWIFWGKDENFAFKDLTTNKWVLSEMDSLSALNSVYNSFDSVRFRNTGLRKRIDVLVNAILLYDQFNDNAHLSPADEKRLIRYQNKISDLVNEYDSLTKIYP